MLLSNGHPQAARYTIGRVFDETRLVVDRKNADMATMAVLFQAASATTSMGATKDSQKLFNKLITSLNGDT